MSPGKGKFSTIFNALGKVLNFVIFILMALIVIIVFTNVICRYFIGSAIAWSEEVSRFMLIWLSFLGAILAYIRDEHLGLDIVVKKLSVKAAAIVGIITDLLIVYALWLIISGGYSLAQQSMDWLSPATSTPYGYVYLAVPICGWVMLLQTCFKIAHHVKKLITGKEELPC